MQNHLVCSGCRSILLSPRGATNVCCAICNTRYFACLYTSFTKLLAMCFVGTEMAQLVCGGCRALLMYSRSSISVRCSCCNTINIARPAPNQVAHVSCGQCLMVLVYPYGAASCHYVTNIGMGSMRVPIPVPHRPDEVTPAPPSSAVRSLSVRLN